MRRLLKLRKNFSSETGTEKSIAKATRSAYKAIEEVFEDADTPLGFDDFFEYVLESLEQL